MSLFIHHPIWANLRLARESNLYELDKLLVLVLGVAVTCSHRGKHFLFLYVCILLNVYLYLVLGVAFTCKHIFLFFVSIIGVFLHFSSIYVCVFVFALVYVLYLYLYFQASTLSSCSPFHLQLEPASLSAFKHSPSPFFSISTWPSKNQPKTRSR